jgi:chemotaxis protein methyltransferase CheR
MTSDDDLLADGAAAVLPALSRRDLTWFQTFIYEETGIHFKDSKQTMLAGRLRKRLRQLGLPDFREYITYLTERDAAGSEKRELINAVTTNKTDFFRESHHFDYLRDQVIPALRTRAGSTGRRRLRIWSAGCSTGEEPYSLAITLAEHLGPLASWDVKIVASDIDTRVLNTASEGVYPEERLTPIPAALRQRYFQRGKNGAAGLWRARSTLKDLIEFRRINLQEEPWPLHERFDAIFCRNVIIYFDRPTQQRLFERMARQLTPEGLLFLGHSESLFGVSDRFRLIEKTVHQLGGGRTDDGSASGEAQPPAPAPPPRRRPHPTARMSAPVRSRASSQSGGAELPERRLIVGEVFASREPMVISTLLGSCVSACLYDGQSRIGGLNHFLLAGAGEPGTDMGRYGVHAMELLINAIMRLGGVRSNLVAKVFGGAHVLSGVSGVVPEANVRFVREFLGKEGIPVVGERVAGTAAMEVCFYTESGRARVRRLAVTPRTLLAQQERERQRIAREMTRPLDVTTVLF